MEIEQAEPLPFAAAAEQIRNGQSKVESQKSKVERQQQQQIVTDRLPILAYHRIAEDGPASLARYRVTPEAFEAQLRYLRDTGFRGITLDEWRVAMESYSPLPGRAVMIAFDDGYLDFHTHAWPLLRRYGFPAAVFLVSDHIGGTSAWDSAHGEPASLMGWPEIRALRDEGVHFGSHTATHRMLTGLPLVEVVRELARSRAALERELRQRVNALAYPSDQWDPAIAHIAGACGYVYGLTCRPECARLDDRPLTLPRIEITGDDDFARFVCKLSPGP
jgi:peptidoglycan/xylan/chitin deacetylase (PgdA/CDA1 family)